MDRTIFSKKTDIVVSSVIGLALPVNYPGLWLRHGVLVLLLLQRMSRTTFAAGSFERCYCCHFFQPAEAVVPIAGRSRVAAGHYFVPEELAAMDPADYGSTVAGVEVV